MQKQAEPKSADFLLETKSPSANPDKLTVRSGEARQSSQAGGDFYSRLKGFSSRMIINPTPIEQTLFQLLTVNNINFKPQKVIIPYIVDCLIPQKKLVIELDGKPHTENINQLTYDTKRDELLMSLGITIIRFDNDKFIPDLILDIYQKGPNYNPEKVLHLIGQHNKRYAEKGFNNFSILYFKKCLKRALFQEMNRVLRTQRTKVEAL